MLLLLSLTAFAEESNLDFYEDFSEETLYQNETLSSDFPGNPKTDALWFSIDWLLDQLATADILGTAQMEWEIYNARTRCYTLSLTDSGGDGWHGELFGGGLSLINVYAKNQSSTAQGDDQYLGSFTLSEGSEADYEFCAEDGRELTLSYVTSEVPEEEDEQGWTLTDHDGTLLYTSEAGATECTDCYTESVFGTQEQVVSQTPGINFQAEADIDFMELGAEFIITGSFLIGWNIDAFSSVACQMVDAWGYCNYSTQLGSKMLFDEGRMTVPTPRLSGAYSDYQLYVYGENAMNANVGKYWCTDGTGEGYKDTDDNGSWDNTDCYNGLDDDGDGQIDEIEIPDVVSDSCTSANNSVCDDPLINGYKADYDCIPLTDMTDCGLAYMAGMGPHPDLTTLSDTEKAALSTSDPVTVLQVRGGSRAIYSKPIAIPFMPVSTKLIVDFSLDPILTLMLNGESMEATEGERVAYATNEGAAIEWEMNPTGYEAVEGQANPELFYNATLRSHTQLKLRGDLSLKVGPCPACYTHDLISPTSNIYDELKDVTLRIPLGEVLFDLPNTALSAESIDFEAIELGQTAAQSVLFENTGYMDAKAEILLTGDTAHFAVYQDMAFAEAGGGQDIRVEYVPSDVGSHSATLQLITNDPHAPEYTVDLTGSATEVPVEEPEEEEEEELDPMEPESDSGGCTSVPSIPSSLPLLFVSVFGLLLRRRA